MYSSGRPPLATSERPHAWARDAWAGLSVWSAYGCVELVFLSVVSWLALPSHLYGTLHFPLTLLCAAVYAGCGLSVGVLSGLGVAGLRRARVQRALPSLGAMLRSAPLWSVPLAFIANVWVTKGPQRAAVVAAISIAPLAVARISRSVSPRLRHGGPFVDDWTLSLVLVGGYWIAYEAPGASPRWVRECIALGYAVAIPVGAMWLRAVREACAWRGPISSARQAWVHLTVWVALGAASAFLAQQPITREAGSARPRERSPNVLLVTLDTVRADHLRIYGYDRKTAPHLGALAQHATVYTSAIAAGNMTLTSHASLFTGQYPERHGAHPPATPLPASVPALAEILARAGYRTAAVVANTGYVTAEMGLARGFQYFDQRGPVRLASANASGVRVTRGNGYLRGVVGRSAARLIPGYSTRPYYRDAAEISGEVIERLGSLAERDHPFFLFVNYMDAHMPYLPPPPFDRSFPGRDASYSWSDYPALRDDLVHGFRTIRPRERAHLISQYDGAIAYQDQELARVIDRLVELDVYDETLIIVTSDHGEAFGRRGVLTHGATLYQEQIHVPLIVKYPLSRQSHVRDELVDEVDVMPTILDLLGLAIPDAVQGHSLLRAHAAAAVLSESFPSDAAPHAVFERALITPDRFKLIAGARDVQLFDLSRDPGETANLRHRDIGRVGTLRHVLDERLPVQHGEQPALEEALDRHTAQQLRALGYLP